MTALQDIGGSEEGEAAACGYLLQGALLVAAGRATDMFRPPVNLVQPADPDGTPMPWFDVVLASGTRLRVSVEPVP